MRTLSRPMFRYGGPVKEGIMSGIREPLKHGKTAGVGQGLVGDQRFPQTSGREHHAVPLLYAAGAAALRFLPALYRGFRAARAFQPFSKNLGFTNRAKDIFLPRAGLGLRMGAPGEGAGFRVGSLIRSNPTLTAGLGYGGYELLPDGTTVPSTGQMGGPPGGGDRGMYYKKPDQEFKEKTLTEAELRAEADAERAASIKKYEDIMNIKGMNKDAAYKSLIEASKAVGESGDFKGDLKSGKLINKIVQATSKQFDKPEQAREAIRSAILTSEITKETDKEKNALQNLKLEKEMKLLDLAEVAAEKEAMGEDFNDSVLSYFKENKTPPTGDHLAFLAKHKLKIDPTVVPSENIKGSYKKFLEDDVAERKKEGKPFDPGYYIIKDRIFNINETGNVTVVF